VSLTAQGECNCQVMLECIARASDQLERLRGSQGPEGPAGVEGPPGPMGPQGPVDPRARRPTGAVGRETLPEGL